MFAQNLRLRSCMLVVRHVWQLELESPLRFQLTGEQTFRSSTILNGNLELVNPFI